jgi:hypothetical protein
MISSWKMSKGLAAFAAATAAAMHLALNNPASAQVIDLVCGGTYLAEKITADVAPAATRIDLEQRLISTPAGKFRISRIGETTISINEEGPDLILSGSLDRLTGKLMIFGYRPAEFAKLRAGSSAKFATLIELQCSVPKRLF